MLCSSVDFTTFAPLFAKKHIFIFLIYNFLFYEQLRNRFHFNSRFV